MHSVRLEVQSAERRLQIADWQSAECRVQIAGIGERVGDRGNGRERETDGDRAAGILAGWEAGVPGTGTQSEI